MLLFVTRSPLTELTMKPHAVVALMAWQTFPWIFRLVIHVPFASARTLTQTCPPPNSLLLITTLVSPPVAPCRTRLTALPAVAKPSKLFPTIKMSDVDTPLAREMLMPWFILDPRILLFSILVPPELFQRMPVEFVPIPWIKLP